MNSQIETAFSAALAAQSLFSDLEIIPAVSAGDIDLSGQILVVGCTGCTRSVRGLWKATLALSLQTPASGGDASLHQSTGLSLVAFLDGSAPMPGSPLADPFAATAPALAYGGLGTMTTRERYENHLWVLELDVEIGVKITADLP